MRRSVVLLPCGGSPSEETVSCFEILLAIRKRDLRPERRQHARETRKECERVLFRQG